MLSFICNYIIREVGAIYSNKSSRICSDPYTSEGILLNGLISLHLSSPPIPLTSKLLCPSCGSLGVCLGRCFALHCLPAVCSLGWRHSPREALQGREQPLLSTGWVALGVLQLGQLQAPAAWLQPTEIWNQGLCLLHRKERCCTGCVSPRLRRSPGGSLLAGAAAGVWQTLGFPVNVLLWGSLLLIRRTLLYLFKTRWHCAAEGWGGKKFFSLV